MLQASSCLDLFSVLITTADMNDARLFQLAIHLFHLAQKQTGQHDPDYAVSTCLLSTFCHL